MRDDLLPRTPWTFDQDVTDRFEDMVSRSVPDLAHLRLVVADLAAQTVPAGVVVVDHGCSLGHTLETLVGYGRRLFGYDVSAPMVESARRRLGTRATITQLDLTTEVPQHPPADLTAYVLTLQFIDPAQRVGILRRAAAQARPGSLLVVAEKVEAESPGTGQIITNAHHARKLANGYSHAQIRAKARAIAGVLRPLTARNVESMILESGWRSPECVWRCLNFAAWIAVAPNVQATKREVYVES